MDGSILFVPLGIAVINIIIFIKVLEIADNVKMLRKTIEDLSRHDNDENDSESVNEGDKVIHKEVGVMTIERFVNEQEAICRLPNGTKSTFYIKNLRKK